MPSDTFSTRHGLAVFACAPDGPPLRTEGEVTDLVGTASWQGADLVVIPVERLDESFFRLRSGLAGAVLQKFVNYRLRLAIVGDIARHVAASDALRDLVVESNRGNDVWFVPDVEHLDRRLERAAADRRAG